MSVAFELVCEGAVVHSAGGFGAGSRERALQKEGGACAKALGVPEGLGKGLCARVERVEGRVAGNEAGDGA